MHNVDKDQKGSQKRCKQLLCTGLGRITGNWNTFLESHPHAVFTTCFHSKDIILKHKCGWGSSGDSLHLNSGPHTLWHCWIPEIQTIASVALQEPCPVYPGLTCPSPLTPSMRAGPQAAPGAAAVPPVTEGLFQTPGLGQSCDPPSLSPDPHRGTGEISAHTMGQTVGSKEHCLSSFAQPLTRDWQDPLNRCLIPGFHMGSG